MPSKADGPTGDVERIRDSMSFQLENDLLYIRLRHENTYILKKSKDTELAIPDFILMEFSPRKGHGV